MLANYQQTYKIYKQCTCTNVEYGSNQLVVKKSVKSATVTKCGNLQATPKGEVYISQFINTTRMTWHQTHATPCTQHNYAVYSKHKGEQKLCSLNTARDTWKIPLFFITRHTCMHQHPRSAIGKERDREVPCMHAVHLACHMIACSIIR